MNMFVIEKSNRPNQTNRLQCLHEKCDLLSFPRVIGVELL